LVEVLKQKQFSPLPFSRQILIIFAGTTGMFDDLAVDQIRDFEAALYRYVDASNPGVLRAIMEKKVLDDGLKAEMTKVIKQAKDTFVADRKAVEQKDRSSNKDGPRQDRKQSQPQGDGASRQDAKREEEKVAAK
jgi:F-type H+-transporting ATPase subunit alpha